MQIFSLTKENKSLVKQLRLTRKSPGNFSRGGLGDKHHSTTVTSTGESKDMAEVLRSVSDYYLICRFDNKSNTFLTTQSDAIVEEMFLLASFVYSPLAFIHMMIPFIDLYVNQSIK